MEDLYSRSESTSVRVTPSIDSLKLLQQKVVDCHLQTVKALNKIRHLRKEIIDYQDSKSKKDEKEGSYLEELLEGNVEDMEVDNPSRVTQSSQCFGCSFSYVAVLLNFIQETGEIPEFIRLYQDEEFIHTLFRENMRMFSRSLRDPARKAICKII